MIWEMSSNDRSTWSNDLDDFEGEPAALPPSGDAGRYAPGMLLGQGGEAEVRAALDSRLEREVAIKQLSVPGASRSARFVAEARVTARLQHPNIVPIHDLGVTDAGTPYLVMKRVRGRSLRALVESGAAGPLEARLEIFQKLCDAVSFAHAEGVLHRDLKPENVMVGQFGEVLLMDWGAAVPFDTATGVELEPSGLVVGTPGFMAPEQREGVPCTVAVDVYGLGAVLYELLTGKPAFEEGPDLQERVRRGAMTPPRQAAPWLPAELERVIHRALALQPHDRYPTVSALREDIDAVLARRPLVHVRSTPLERLLKWADRHRGPLAVGVIATGLGLVALLMGSWRYGADVGAARDAAVQAADRARAAELDAIGGAVAASVALADTLAAQGQALDAERHLRAAELRLDGHAIDRRALDLAWSQHVADNPPPVANCAPHGGAIVRALALGADGREAWSWGEDGRLVRWDPVGCVERSARALGQVAGPGALDAERGIGAFIVDGSLVRVELASGEELRVPAPPDVNAVGLDAGQLWVRDADAAVWTLTPERTGLVQLSGGAVAGSSWRPAGGGRFQLADCTHTGRELGGVWRFGASEPLFAGEDINSVDLSADGSALIFGDPAGLGVVDVGGGVRWRRDQAPVSTVGLAPGGAVGWAQAYDGTVRLFDAATGAPLADYVGSGDMPTAIAATPGARLLVIAGGAGRVLTYLRPTFPARTPPQPLHGLPQGLALSPDGARLALGDEDGQVALIDVATGRTLRRWSGWKTGVRQLAFSPDGRRVAAAVRYDGVAVLDPDRDAVLSVPLPVRTVSVAWTEGGLTTIDVDGKILSINPDTGQVTPRGQGLEAASWGLAARDGQLLTAGHAGGEHGLLLLSGADGQVLRRLPLAELGFHVAWSPDGRRAAVALSGGKAVIVDLSDGRVLRELAADAGPTIGVAWSPDGALVATTGYSRQVKIWDPDTGALLRALQQHGGPGVNVLFSPDGSRVYSSGTDGYRVLALRAHQEHEADVAALMAGGAGRAAALARLGWWERVEEFAEDTEQGRRLVAEARLALTGETPSPR